MEKSPFKVTYRLYVPASAQAADTTLPVFTAEFACELDNVKYTPIAAIQGAATNNRTIKLINKEADGQGTGEPALLNFADGVDAAAFVPKAITCAAVPLAIAAGDTIAVQSLHVGDGIADPGGLIEITVSRTE